MARHIPIRARTPPHWMLAALLIGNLLYAGVSPVVIKHGSRKEKKLALTFDACSTRAPSHFDERVTQVLVDTKTRATIFLGGRWMEEEGPHVKYLASLPQFELANHTYSHPHLPALSDSAIREELEKTQAVFKKMQLPLPLLFRPPFGEYDERVVKIAADAGIRTVEYDLAAGDPDIHFTKEILTDYVSKTAREGSIVVMHINKRGWHTAEALPDIIRNLRAKGYELVKVSELDTSEQTPDPKTPETAGRHAKSGPIVAWEFPLLTKTKTGTPADPLNLGLVGSLEAIYHAFEKAGYHPADPHTVKKLGLRLGTLTGHPPPRDLTNELYLWDRIQDLSFEKRIPETGSDQHHHVRLWKTRRRDERGNVLWIGAATRDRGLIPRTFSHHIFPDVDAERDLVAKLLATNGCEAHAPASLKTTGPVPAAKNAEGDPFRTDGNASLLTCADGPAK